MGFVDGVDVVDGGETGGPASRTAGAGTSYRAVLERPTSSLEISTKAFTVR